jgi:hypothetical protein
MHTVVTASGVLSTAITVYCTVPYWRSILAGRTKPHQFTWIIFTVMNGIIATSQILAGASWSASISVTFTVGSAVNAALSFRYGMRDSSRHDRALFSAALLTIAVWILTKNNAVAIWLTVVIDVFATAMIVLKIRSDHTSEDPRPWVLASSAFAGQAQTRGVTTTTASIVLLDQLTRPS